MQTATEPFRFEQDGWVIRARKPDNPAGAGLMVLVHGWKGDETVMWIFARLLATRFWLLAPRAPLAAPGGGFGWLMHHENRSFAVLSDYQPAAQRFFEALPGWVQGAGFPTELVNQPINLMGFSQGAAMSYALAAYYPERVKRLAALAGYLPSGQPELLESFQGKPVYIAHGSRDETIPVAMARETSEKLTSAGAIVTYCESDVGHKLSAQCLRGVEEFFD